MDIFTYNSQILADERHYVHELSDEYGTDLSFVVHDDNIEWFLNEKEQESYPIVDEIDTRQESPNAKRREIIFVVGVNSIREIEELYVKMNPNSYMIVYEPDPAFLAHALSTKDLRVFSRRNVSLIVCPPKRLLFYMNRVFNSTLLLLMGNIKIYLTHFYRQFDKKNTKHIIEIISLAATSNRWGAGNSIDDCLEGSTQVLQNLKYLCKAKDVRKFKNAFKDKPLIIVSAGPSLEKNIKLLHEVEDKAIIVATESILERLLKEGIMPHFVTTMERVIQAYEFSYKGRNIPPEVTLVAPPVIKPMIFEEYKGNYIIPMREGVREFAWWEQLLGLGADSFVMVGDSTAHLAFGWAIHIGANPIVFVGQDLAFGNTGTTCHAGGTIYEKIGTNYQHDPMQEPNKQTEGYYGGLVTTNQLWMNFKKWFELYIEVYQGKIHFINATEGGAKIQGAVQLTLREVIDQYCKEKVSVTEFIDKCQLYSLNEQQIIDKLTDANKELVNVKKQAKSILKKLDKINVTKELSEAQLKEVYFTLKKTDELWKKIKQHPLLFHNMQPMIIQTFYKLYKIDEELNSNNMANNLQIQKEFIETFLFVIEYLFKAIQEAITDLQALNKAI